MLPNSSVNTYKQQQVLTATPEQLILMLYNGCIKFINEAEKHIQNKSIEQAHISCTKAQDIVLELIATLNMEYPISKELFTLYEYVNYELMVADLNKDVTNLQNAKKVIMNLREGWNEALKTVRADADYQPPQSAAANSGISI